MVPIPYVLRVFIMMLLLMVMMSAVVLRLVGPVVSTELRLRFVRSPVLMLVLWMIIGMIILSLPFSLLRVWVMRVRLLLLMSLQILIRL